MGGLLEEREGIMKVKLIRFIDREEKEKVTDNIAEHVIRCGNYGEKGGGE